jgi:hypothetical protein
MTYNHKLNLLSICILLAFYSNLVPLKLLGLNKDKKN